MTSEFDASIFVVLPIIIFVGVIALLRLRMEMKIGEIPNFSSSMCFIGPASAINFDFDSSRVAYIELSQKEATILQSEDLAIAGKADYALTETIPKGFLTRFVNAALNGEHLVTINTNVYDLPELKIAFWDRKKAQQCTIALREITQSKFDSDVNKMASEDIKNKLAQLVEKKLKSEGFSAEPIGKKIGKEKIYEYIDYLHNNFEETFARERSQGDGALIVEVLGSFFGVQDGKGSSSGYRPNTLIKYVSERHTAILENAEKSKTKK